MTKAEIREVWTRFGIACAMAGTVWGLFVAIKALAG